MEDAKKSKEGSVWSGLWCLNDYAEIPPSAESSAVNALFYHNFIVSILIPA
jgi:hypothetical protein